MVLSENQLLTQTVVSISFNLIQILDENAGSDNFKMKMGTNIVTKRIHSIHRTKWPILYLCVARAYTELKSN